MGSLQILTTVLIVAAPVANAAKVAFLLAWWLLTFWPLQLREVVFYTLACAFFTVMDVLTVGGGAFQFTHPDILGLPWYEPFLWGFYLLHTLRMMGGAPPPVSAPQRHREDGVRNKGVPKSAVVLAILFALVFSFVREPQALTFAATGLLICGLALYRNPADFAYSGYMILVGALIEYVGVWSGEWSYPGAPWGGVALWFIPLWGGIGLLLRRIGLPLISNSIPGNRI